MKLHEYLVGYHELTSEEVEALLDQVEEYHGAILRTNITSEEAENIQNELEERGATAELGLMYSVFGTVQNVDNTPASDIAISVIRQGDTDEEVGTDLTDSEGKFEVRYIPPQIEEVTLVARAFHRENENQLAESDPIESPAETEEVNLIVNLPSINSEGPVEERMPSLGNDIFRFAVIRPPESSHHPDIIFDTVTKESKLWESLIARKAEDDRAGMIQEAHSYLDSRLFVADEGDLSIPVFDLDAKFSGLDSSATETEYRAIIEEVTGQQPENLIKHDEYQNNFQELGDSLLAATLVPGQSSETSRLARSIQIYSLIHHLGTEGQGFEGVQISNLLERDIGLPDELFPLPRLSNDTQEKSKRSEQAPAEQLESSPTEKTTSGDLKELQQRLAQLREAREELTFAKFTNVTDESNASFETDGDGRPDDFRQSGPDARLPYKRTGDGGLASDFLASADRVITAARWVVNGSQVGYNESRVSVEDEISIDPDDEEEILDIQQTKVLSANAIDALSAETVETLHSLNLEIESTEVTQISDRIEREEKKIERKLLKTAPADLSIPMVSVGGQMLPATEIQQMLSDAAGIETANKKDTFSIDSNLSLAAISGLLNSNQKGIFTDARIKPIGCMDLRVVRQEIKRYELGEVAHIENVLKSETKDRTHRRKRTTDETSIYERETSEETEQDLQSTERFELQREAEEVIKEESSRDSNSSIETDTTVKASYGPILEVNAGFGYSSQSSSAQQNTRESAVRTASSYSRSVTERAVNRLQNRLREEQIQRVIEEVEETNVHGFKNTGADAEHISGIYRWVNKVYRNQQINYGVPRMMFEFIVPEPAFLHLWAQSNPTDTVSKPSAPKNLFDDSADDSESLLPEHLTEETYQKYAQIYGANDISPPPQKYRITSKKIHHQESQEPKPEYISEVTKVDEGYTPIKARFSVANLRIRPNYESTNSRPGNGIVNLGPNPDRLWPKKGNHVLQIRLGGTSFIIKYDSGSKYVDVKDIEFESSETYQAGGAEIPISIFANRLRGFAAGIEVLAERTERSFQQWQIDTYNAIMDGYRNQLSKYEEEVAAAEVTGISIAGNNPNDNRKIERDELKRSILTMLNNERLEFNAIDDPTITQPLPDINIAGAEEQQDLIHFLENAFEWENMNYVFYSYYWGRRNTWVDKLNLDNPDPQFAQFLKAGAARVLVPVRHDEENRWVEDVAHYLSWGEPYKGQGRPKYGDPQYVDIINDIKSRQGAEKEGGTVEDEWDITLPTSLVKLQEDGEDGADAETLPVFIPELEGGPDIADPEVDE